MIYQTIDLFDGNEKIEAKLVASFSIDDKDYCCLELEDEYYLAEFFEEGDDMVFRPIEDEDEFNEVSSIFMDLLEDQEKKQAGDDES